MAARRSGTSSDSQLVYVAVPILYTERFPNRFKNHISGAWDLLLGRLLLPNKIANAHARIIIGVARRSVAEDNGEIFEPL